MLRTKQITTAMINKLSQLEKKIPPDAIKEFEEFKILFQHQRLSFDTDSVIEDVKRRHEYDAENRLIRNQCEKLIQGMKFKCETTMKINQLLTNKFEKIKHENECLKAQIEQNFMRMGELATKNRILKYNTIRSREEYAKMSELLMDSIRDKCRLKEFVQNHDVKHLNKNDQPKNDETKQEDCSSSAPSLVYNFKLEKSEWKKQMKERKLKEKMKISQERDQNSKTKSKCWCR